MSEEELIAYQMGEAADQRGVATHLEACAECAALAESIAETLRVFSAEPVPQVNMDHAWQRLRGGLPALAVERKPRCWQTRWGWVGPVLAICLLVGFVLVNRAGHRAPTYANGRPGPLTMQPVGAPLADHLDSAERLLTEVNHATGPLDESTLAEAHQLRLTNAVYVEQAHAAGDLAQVNVLENLGRVLTTLDHAPQRQQEKGWHIRLEMNTDGLLLDLRILQQNDAHDNEKEAK